MKNIYLYAHGGSGNHGCEAIVRSTIELFKSPESKFTLISSRPDEDKRYGIGNICDIITEQSNYPKFSTSFLSAYIHLKLTHDFKPLDKLYYKEAFDHLKKGDIALSIGGDNYCYADVERYIMMHDMLLDRGVKTVLWGCSVEPELLKRKSIADDIARYSLITARESISYEALRVVNPNTVLLPDPAFSLKCSETDLPDGFISGNMVGINLSPMVVDKEATPGIAMNNYRKLIDYILTKTDIGIALIPHVVWDFTDDRKPLAELYELYKNSGRVVLVNDKSCSELKYIISKCRFFVGARTHATIAAYSTCVPTLVVGYSVKARGIARDLFGSEDGYVLPVQELTSAEQLLHEFESIFKNEWNIKKVLDFYQLVEKMSLYDDIKNRIGNL